MKIRALVVAPYEGLGEIVRQVVRDFPHFDIEIEIGNLEEGLKIVRRKNIENYDVIISRGGTAEYIREEVSVPVIDIQVSGYDMLRTLTLVNSYPGKAALVGFHNITQGASTICSVLELDIKNVTIKSREEVKKLVVDLKKDHYDLVIGDVVTVTAAKEIGITGILITSGIEAVSAAFEEAERAHQLYYGIKRELTLYKTIFEHEEHGLLLFDGQEVIQRNKKASVYLNTEEKIEAVRELALSSIKEKRKKSSTIEEEGTIWKVYAKPVLKETDSFCFIKLEKLFSKTDHSIGIEVETFTTVPTITGTSPSVLKVKKEINDYSKGSHSIWITGEEGTGKSMVAQAIHKNSVVGYLPLVTLECSLITATKWEEIFQEKGYFHDPSFGSIFLKNIHQLDLEIQKQLLIVLKERKTGPKLIISSHQNMIDRISKEQFLHDLYYVLAERLIGLSPLSERKEDIEALVHLFISHSYEKYGKQLVGIRKEALDELTNYEWPGNIDQLQQIIEQLIIHANSYYIEHQDVIENLRLLTTKSVSKSNELKITGTLEEIEKQIITQVLEEEGMNQSRAAERLGINRSTLWRKLKS